MGQFSMEIMPLPGSLLSGNQQTSPFEFSLLRKQGAGQMPDDFDNRVTICRWCHSQLRCSIDRMSQFWKGVHCDLSAWVNVTGESIDPHDLTFKQ